LDNSKDDKSTLFFDLNQELRSGTKTNKPVKPVVFGPTFMVVVTTTTASLCGILQHVPIQLVLREAQINKSVARGR
jgi:hypothetical protein